MHYLLAIMKQVWELSIESALHNDIEMEKVIEKTIDFDDVWMVEVHLYLYLP